MRPPEAADSPLCVTSAVSRRWVVALPNCRIGATGRFHAFSIPSIQQKPHERRFRNRLLKAMIYLIAGKLNILAST